VDRPRGERLRVLGAASKIFGETIPIVPPGIDVTLREFGVWL
jgi:hypothetical protein